MKMDDNIRIKIERDEVQCLAKGETENRQRVGWFNLKNAAGWNYLLHSFDLYPWCYKL